MPRNCKCLVLVIGLLSGIFTSLAQKGKSQEIYSLLVKSDSLLFLSEYRQSLEYSSQALRLALQSDDFGMVALAYNSIAGNMEEIRDMDNALAYYRKSLKAVEKSKADSLYVWIYNNVGNVYLNGKKQIDSSIYYFKKSLDYANEQNYEAVKVVTHLNLSWAHFQLQQDAIALQYLETAEKNIHLYDYPDTRCYLNLLKGIRFSKKSQVRQANQFFESAITSCLEFSGSYLLPEAYHQYAIHLSNSGDYEKAYAYLDKYQLKKEELLDFEQLKSVKLLGMQMELEEVKQVINDYELENNLQKELLIRSKVMGSLFFAFLLLMAFVLLLLYKNIKFKRKVNEYLTLKNKELELAKEKAEEASKLKTQFISTVSHELRTPLYGVVGITNMLSEEHKELLGSPHLNSLKFSARYLLSLVNDLLQINKIEEKNIELENHTFNLIDELQLIERSLTYMAERNLNKIIVKTDPKIPELLVGDKIRLSQILMNLVSNALKFTREGLVTVEVNQCSAHDGLVELEFKVSDTGIGISKDDLSKIFEKFVQVGRKEDDYQGTGLGLSIVQKLIELFKGSIRVESEVGVGTVFTFNITFDSRPERIKDIVNNIEVDLSNDRQYKILVVEDNKINQMVTRKIMEKNHYKSLIVDDGYAAMEALAKESFDAVLMDINMPLINGFETTRLIRKKGNQIPIIALTAFAKDEIETEALESGMNEILIKPFEASKLNKIIETLVKKEKD